MGKEVVRALTSRFTGLTLHVLDFMSNRPIRTECFNPGGRSRYVATKVGMI